MGVLALGNSEREKDETAIYNARTGALASSTDPNTWSTFAEVVAAGARFDGSGFVVTDLDPFVGVDLDHCVDEAGQVEPWAQAIVSALDSYTEITPSGRGLRIFVRGKLPGGGRKRGNVEVYDSGRYLTVTARRVPNAPRSIEHRQVELERLLAEHFPERPTTTNGHRPTVEGHLADTELLDRARQAKHGDRFRALYDEGDWQRAGYASQSEADLALAHDLVFWTNRDVASADRLFRASGLYRPKWDERHGASTYGQRTLERADSGLTEGCTGTVTATSALGAMNGARAAVMENPASEPPRPAPPVAAVLGVPTEGVIGIGRSFATLSSQYLESPSAFFYFAFLTYFGSLIAKKVTLETELRPAPRLYTVVIGESADTRKSTALRAVDVFFQSLGSPWTPAVLFGVGSAEGLAAELKDQSELILHYDEFKSFVDKAKNEHSVALPMVTTLFERGEYDNRTKTERVSVRAASLSLVAACTSDTYATMFDQRFFAIGLLNRLWLVSDRSSTRIAVPQMIPSREVDALRTQVAALLASIDTDYVNNGRRPVAYRLTPAALDRFRAWYEAREGSLFERRLDTYAHRLMILLTATTGKTTVDEEVVAAVITLLRYQLDVRRDCDPVDAENTIAMVEEKIRRALARGAVRGRDLKRKVNYQRVGLWVWKTAVANLTAAGEMQHDPKSDLYWLVEPVITSVITTLDDVRPSVVKDQSSI